MSLLSFSPSDHPLIAGGGLFLLIVGTALVIGERTARFRGRWLTIGFILGGTLAALGARIGGPYGSPTRLQVGSLVLAIAVEMTAIPLVFKRFPGIHGKSRTLVILLIVALHFFIMMPAFGGIIVILGLLCLCNVAWGYWQPGYHSTAVSMTDGILKAAVGLVMVSLALLR